jgi:hypothetical protein
VTVEQLIKHLQQFPSGATVYRDGGDYKDDWRVVTTAAYGQSWEKKGVFLE